MQIPGCTPADVTAITQCYPTVASLLQAYNECAVETRPNMLTDVRVGGFERGLDQKLSQLIYHCFCI
jgi:hypothetical protein